MNQYGTGQNVPYSGQQEANLVNNPRYTGQSAGTNPLGHDGRGPAEESRYGAMPLSTNTGVDQYGNPRREGVVDKMKDAVGMGPNSGATGYDARRDQPGYDARRDQSGYGTPGYDNYGQPRKEGVVDKMKDAVGMGPNSGAHTGTTTGYDQSGLGSGFGGHHTGTGTGAGYDQSGLGSGFGTHHHDGVHVVPGHIPVVDLGERRVEPGYDASRGQFGHHHQGTTTGGPRKEGIVDKFKDAVGVGHHDNVAQAYPGTTTGTILPNTFGTGESGLGHHNTTSTFGSTPGVGMHHDNVGSAYPGNTYGTGETGLGHHNTTSTFGSTPGVGMHHDNVGSAYPGNAYGTGETGLGHHNTPIGTPGSYSHNSMVDTGLGHERHPGSNTGYPHETLGERMEDRVGMRHHDDYERTGMHDSRTGAGYDATNVDHPRMGSEMDDTNVNYPNNDGAYVDGAPPKKGMMAKIKEKMHH